jgi:hypothetical protein
LTCGPRDSPAAGDQIVNEDRDAILDVHGENVADDADFAAIFVYEGLGDRPFQHALQPQTKEFHALLAAEISRDDRDQRIANLSDEAGREQRLRAEVNGLATKRVLERGDVVHVNADDVTVAIASNNCET